MPDQLNILVCGATGKQGGATARALLARGYSFRALTRDPDQPAARKLAAGGAEVLRGDMTDRSDCDRVLRGIHAAFLMTTPYERGYEEELRQAATFGEAAAAAGLEHLVVSSAAGCRAESRPLHFDSKFEVERRIEKLAIPFTFIEPVYFMENIFLPDSVEALRGDKLAIPLSPDRPLQQVTTEDVGRFAALALLERDRYMGRTIELAGDELTGREAASVLSELTGREIGYLQVPLEAVRRQNELIAGMYQWFEDVGFSADVEALRRDTPEVDWHDFRSWAREAQIPAAA